MSKKYQRTSTGMLRSQPRHPVTGKRVTITAETQAEMEQKLTRFRVTRSDMTMGLTQNEAEARLAPALGVRMTVDEAWEKYERGLSRSIEKGRWAWRKRLAPWFSGKNIIQLTGDLLRAWEADHIRAGFAMATIGLAYDMLAAAINLQVPAVVPCLPWGKWRPARESKDELYTPKRPALWDMASFEALAAAAARDDEEAWRKGRYSVYCLTTMLLVLTGLRQGEAAGLGWDHVSIDDPSNDVLFVEFQAGPNWFKRWGDRPLDPPKDGARRQRLHPVVKKLLLNQRAQLQVRGWYRADGPVLPAPGGKWLRGGEVVKPSRVKRWAAAAGLRDPEKWCAHSMRHSFVMLELEANQGDLISVMERSGHSDLRIIRGYMHAKGLGMAAAKVDLQLARGEAMMPALDGSSAFGPPLLEAPALDESQATALLETNISAFTRATEARQEAAVRKRDESYDSFDDVYARWVAAGRPSKQPKEVTARARRAYLKGYNRGVRKREPAERCAALGKQERGRFIGAWRLFLQRMAKVSGGEAAQ